jgi:small conductance mechanosensitive channel
LRIFTKAAEKLKVDSSVKTLLRTVIKILLYIITFLTVANTLGIPITSMLAVFGIVGLAVSLAAQNSLAKLAGGLMILATHPFKAGDFIEAAGGISGTVQSIGLAYTKVRMPDNKIIMVPNSSIANEIITNFSVEENRRLDINVRIGYEHPIEDVKRALHAAIETQSGILDEPEPFVNVFSYEDNSIQYIVRAWTKTSEFWPTRFRLLEEIKHSLDAQGIGMSYNRLDVNLRDKSE